MHEMQEGKPAAEVYLSVVSRWRSKHTCCDYMPSSPIMGKQANNNKSLERCVSLVTLALPLSAYIVT